MRVSSLYLKIKETNIKSNLVRFDLEEAHEIAAEEEGTGHVHLQGGGCYAPAPPRTVPVGVAPYTKHLSLALLRLLHLCLVKKNNVFGE